jgi:hypothetical protein
MHKFTGNTGCDPAGSSERDPAGRGVQVVRREALAQVFGEVDSFGPQLLGRERRVNYTVDTHVAHGNDPSHVAVDKRTNISPAAACSCSRNAAAVGETYARVRHCFCTDDLLCMHRL